MRSSLKNIRRISLACILAFALIAGTCITSQAAAEPADDKSLDRLDALVTAVYQLYSFKPASNLLPDDYNEFDFIPLYDDYQAVVAWYVRFSNGSYIIVNNNKENPYILESGTSGCSQIDNMLETHPEMEIIYDGEGMIRGRDFETFEGEVEVPQLNYHTLYGYLEIPDPYLMKRLADGRENMLDSEGRISEEWISKLQTESFVSRLYNVCLARDPDESGLSDWVKALNEGASAGKVIKGFFFSQEYLKYNKMATLYVIDLYRAFFDREGDVHGLEDWTDVILYGATREQVFRGFARSEEFAKYCEQYGLTP